MIELKLSRLTDKEIKDLHAELKEEFDRLCVNRYFLERQWEINDLSVFTKQKYVLKRDGAIARLSTVDSKKDYYIGHNNLFKVYRASLAKLVNAMPLMQINTSSMETTNEYSGELAEALITNEQKEMKKRGVQIVTMKDYITKGNCFLKQYYNKEKGAFNGIDENGNKVPVGECEIRAKSPYQVIFDPSVYSIEYAPKVFENWFVPAKVFKKLYPNANVSDTIGLGIDNSIKNKILLSGDFLNIDKRIDTREYVQIIKVYIEPNVTNEKWMEAGCHVLMTHTEILEIKLAESSDPFINPFSQAKRIETGTAYGETPISYSVSVDRDIALSRGQLAEHAEKFSSPMLLLSTGSTIQSEKIANRYVKVIYYNSKYGEPKYIQPTEFGQYFYQNLSRLETDLNDINAIHDSSYGKRESGTRSGLQQAYMIDKDDAQHMPDVSAYYAMYASGGNKYLNNVKDKHIEKRTLQIFGLDNVKYLTYTGAELKDNTTIDVEVISGLPLDRQQRQQAVVQLATLNAVPKRMLLKILDLGELNAYYRTGMKDRIRQIMEIDKLAVGKKIETNFEDDDIIHIEELFAWFKTSKFFDLSEKVKLNAYKHALEHRDNMMKIMKEFPLAAIIKCNLGAVDEVIMSAIQAELKLYETKLIKENPEVNQGGGNLPTQNQPDQTAEGNAPTEISPEEMQGQMQAMGAIPPQVAAQQAAQQQTGG